MSIHPYETVHRMKAAMAIPSIGAVATQKIPSDALNLGFPSAYQSVYAAFVAPKRAPAYFSQPERAAHGFDYIGHDLQADYHASKKAEADKMAAAKVRSTQNSRIRYTSTPHGRGILPPDILAQRKYANQSNGALSATSARRDQAGAPFSTVESVYVGGVLRSPAGQRYGQAVLQKRVGELNAIQQAAQDFGLTPGIAPRAQDTAEMATATQLPTVNESSAIELNLLLESVLNALYSAEAQAAGEGGDQLTRFTLGDATRALLLIFRMVPTAPIDFAEDLMAKVDTIVQLLNGTLDPETESAGMKVEAKEIALTLQVLFTKLRTYLQRMIGGTAVERKEQTFNPLTGRPETRTVISAQQGQNLSPKERVALSKNLVKELGFSKLLKYRDDQYNMLLSAADREGLMNAQQAQRYAEGDIDDEEEDDDDDDEEDEFDLPAAPREDEAHRAEGGPRRGDRAGFDRDERVDFGDNQGLVMGPDGAQFQANAFLGEDGAPALDAGDEAAGAAADAAPRRRAGVEGDIRAFFNADLGIHDIEALPRPRDLAPPRAAAAAAAAVPTPPASVVSSRASTAPLPAAARALIARTREIIPNRAALPKPGDKAAYRALAERLRAVGFQIRVSEKGSSKANFIKRLGL
jgi:hypothetical protein